MGISIGGLSGLDTDSIVSQLIELEKAPITKLTTRKSKYETQKSAFESFNLKLLALKSSSESLLTSSSWSAKKNSVSNSDILTATSSSTAAEGTYKFTNVALGNQAFSYSTANVNNGAALTTSAMLNTLTFNGGATTGDVSGTIGYKIKRVSDDSVVSSSTITYDTTTDSINTLVTKINRSSADITAYYDETPSGSSGKFVLTANDAGAYYIEIDETADANPNKLMSDYFKMLTNTNNADSGAIASEGTDTTAELNGVAINPNGNSYTVNGTTVNFLGNGDSTVSVSRNTDAMVTMIKDFVAKYNDVQDFIKEQTKMTTATTLSNKTSDTSSRGPLAGNFLVTDISYNLNIKSMQSYSTLRTEDQYSMLTEIGISLGQYGTADQNRMVIDESKLSAALAANPEEVQLLFGFKNSNPTQTNVVVDSGIAYQIKEYLNPITKYKGMIANEQEAINSIMDSLDDQISRMEDRVSNLEEMYRKQFSRMEQQLATLNSQGDYFSSQMSSLSS